MHLENSGGKPKVLIVEGDANLAFYWTANLIRLQFQVTQTFSRKSALQALSEEKPDLMIVDVQLPDGDGIHVIREAKKQNPDVRCLVVSGRSSSEHEQSAMEAGACAYLRKPCWWEHIENVLLHDYSTTAQ